jgi:hypothetical protein
MTHPVCADLKPLADRIAAERAAMNDRSRAAFPPAAVEWRAHFAAAAQAGLYIIS